MRTTDSEETPPDSSPPSLDEASREQIRQAVSHLRLQGKGRRFIASSIRVKDEPPENR